MQRLKSSLFQDSRIPSATNGDRLARYASAAARCGLGFAQERSYRPTEKAIDPRTQTIRYIIGD